MSPFGSFLSFCGSQQRGRKSTLFFFIFRLPEFKSFEELELPKHSKVKRQSSASNSPELEQQPDVTMAEWKSRPTHEILQKLQASTTRPPGPERGGRAGPPRRWQ